MPQSDWLSYEQIHIWQCLFVLPMFLGRFWNKISLGPAASLVRDWLPRVLPTPGLDCSPLAQERRLCGQLFTGWITLSTWEIAIQWISVNRSRCPVGSDLSGAWYCLSSDHQGPGNNFQFGPYPLTCSVKVPLIAGFQCHAIQNRSK